MNTKEFFSSDELDLIRRESGRAEECRKMSSPILRLIYSKGWLKVLEPSICNGLQWELPRVVRLFEALAYSDGNLGWCVNLGAGANMFAGYFEERTAKAIFSNPQTWCAGSGTPSGKAYEANGGYNLSGRWKYASGATHATHFTANAYLFDKNCNPITKNGKLVFRSFIIPAKKVKVDDTWYVSGLKATSSNGFEIENVFVPKKETFSLLEPSPFAWAPIFHFPFQTMAVVNMAVMPVGMAWHFLSLFETLMTHKIPLNSTNLLGKNKRLQALFQSVKTQLQSDRDRMYKTLDHVWGYYLQGATASEIELSDLQQNAITAAQTARKTVNKLLPLTGMDAVFENTEINKVWRDINVAGQHYLLAKDRDFML